MKSFWLMLGLLLLSACATTSPDTFLIDDVPATEVQTLEDGTQWFMVHPDQIRSGGPPKDGIPSIDNPEYISVEEADQWIADNELVLAIIRNDVKRVYPLQILVWHEIVNDYIGDEPVVITYCPLCGSGIAYEPIVNGQRVEFGTTGKLYNSNLIMYDRSTEESSWTQIDGIAIQGPLAGHQLTPINIDTVVWREWKATHPDSEVLSQNTGFNRNYGRDPYGSYYEDSFLIFPVNAEDDRLHPKDVVFGFSVDGQDFAVREDDLIAEDGQINTEVNGVAITVSRDQAGSITIVREDTGAGLFKERDFWFAWYAFHPETGLYQN